MKINVMRNRYVAEFLRFLGVGLINTIIGLGTIFFLMAVFKFNYLLANIIGYTFALGNSFLLNRKWTFKNDDLISVSKITKFIIVFGISYLIQAGVLIILAEVLGLNRYFAQVASIIAYTCIGYFGNKFITFKKVEEDEEIS